jgi:hypothetical protein
LLALMGFFGEASWLLHFDLEVAASYGR